MAEALLAGMFAGLPMDPASVLVTDPSDERRAVMHRRFGIRVGTHNAEAAAWADVVVLAVKPQVVRMVLEEIGSCLAGRFVISIAAGISIQTILSSVPEGTRVARVMPNLPAVIREGASAVAFGPGLSSDDRRVVETLCSCVGRTVVVEEPLLDAVTALSGSGPAYVLVAIEALADGAVKLGLPRVMAHRLAAETVAGSAKRLLEGDPSIARSKQQVLSPGGPAMAGLEALERGGFRSALIAAVEAGTRRAHELRGA